MLCGIHRVSYIRKLEKEITDTMKGGPQEEYWFHILYMQSFPSQSTRLDNRYWEFYTMKDLSVYILWDDLGEKVWLHSSAKITYIMD